jgi:protein gp37
MPDNTPIQWTDATWNPIRGCSRVSEGCRNCYAEAIAARFSGPGLAYEGLARRRSNGEPQWTGEVRAIESHLYDPLRWRKPKRVFVNSMSDLFHQNLARKTIDNVFAVMALAPRHTFQVLTKRPARMREYLSEDGVAGRVIGTAWEMLGRRPLQNYKHEGIAQRDWPLPNVWLGVSVENQDAANERIPLLTETPAALRFLSCEPLLGPIDFDECGSRSGEDGDPCAFSALRGPSGVEPPIPSIDWVIVGGESGPHARGCNLPWIEQIVLDCRAARVPVFVKQLGAHPFVRLTARSQSRDFNVRDSHGADMAEWPRRLRMREFPEVRR